MSSTWRLPAGIVDLSPTQANRLYQLSYQLIKYYQNHNYQMVMPPVVEYDSNNLYQKNQAFTTLDITDGQALAIRADITPQIARIDYKYCPQNKSGRYAYIAEVLTKQADDFYASRNPIQAGAELYGNADLDADIEIIKLMQESLGILGFSKNITLSLGHIGVVNALIEASGLNGQNLERLTTLIKHRSHSDLAEFCKHTKCENTKDWLDLLQFSGDIDTLDRLTDRYRNNKTIISITEQLQQLSNQLATNKLKIHIDAVDIGDKDYHTGLLFAYYCLNYSKPLAQGGRYDGIKSNRPATGFSLDLKFLSTQQER